MEEVKKHNNNEEPELKGTAYSVTFVGVFILVTWIGALLLFLSRG